MQKINVKAFALACAVVFGVSALFLGWMAMFGWGTKIVEMTASLYIGYTATFWGAIIGSIWAFVDWLIGGAILALVYNAFIDEKKIINPDKTSNEDEHHDHHENHEHSDHHEHHDHHEDNQ